MATFNIIKYESHLQFLEFLWTEEAGQTSAITYSDLLRKDTDIPAEELSNCMRDKTVWRSVTARADR